jgi:hypothetical protein
MYTYTSTFYGSIKQQAKLLYFHLYGE